MRIASGNLLFGSLFAYYLFPHKLTSVYLFLVYLGAVAPTQQKQKEKAVTAKSDEGSSIMLKCNPPQSSMEPIIHWMDQSEFVFSNFITHA